MGVAYRRWRRTAREVRVIASPLQPNEARHDANVVDDGHPPRRLDPLLLRAVAHRLPPCFSPRPPFDPAAHFMLTSRDWMPIANDQLRAIEAED